MNGIPRQDPLYQIPTLTEGRVLWNDSLEHSVMRSTSLTTAKPKWAKAKEDAQIALLDIKMQIDQLQHKMISD
jgi:hypothetical protein